MYDLSGPVNRRTGQRLPKFRSPGWPVRVGIQTYPDVPSRPRKLISVLFSLNLQTQRGTVRARPRAQESTDTGLQPVPEMPALHQCSAPGCSFHWARPDKAEDGYPTDASNTATYGLGLLQPLLKSTQAPCSFLPPVLVSTVIFLEKGSVRGQKCCWNFIRAPQGGAGQLPGPCVLERYQITSLSPCLP